MNNGEAGLKKEGLVILILSFALTLVVMNTMMFNLALPDVEKQFSLTAIATSWIVTGYSIMFAIASITYSRLSDFIPMKLLFLIALSSLGVASILGFFSNSFILLMAARLIQATGAGAIAALGIVLVTRFIPADRRGRAMALIMSATSLGLGLGPVIGGVIVEYLGWHYLFAVTAIMILLIPMFYKMIPAESRKSGSFDVAGALLIGIGTTGLLLALTSKSLIALIVGVVAVALFWWRIHKAKDPFVQPDLFRNKPYMLLGMLGVTSYMNNFAALFLVPQVLAGVYHLTPAQSGLIVFPGSLATMVASRYIGSTIDRLGNRFFIRLAPVGLFAASLALAFSAVHSYWAILIIYMLLSVSFSALTSSVSNEMSRLLPQKEIGAGMGLFQLAQFFSGALTAALIGTAIVWQAQLAKSEAFNHILWGMSVIVLGTVVSSLLYTRSAARQASRQAA
ncbi:tetracycline resistance protein TetA [Paenibacillus sp. BIHB 4019]|uniref:Tetracycline resistance protein TetA n=1 Tax=Paenibacillus sp. BIHB 4019 TaxID=1870819 RepID=A0A1B2DK65_9BACL|nr:MFS transporter [Paenibacillus sp. BIHB 4019]ANY68075.1 tetracycline resistance protein TetA [Paenibacillus sp. BIHB 4019]